MHGRGVYTWTDGKKYDGQWKDGKKHGRGVVSEADGRKYDGQWKDGKEHGRGLQGVRPYDGTHACIFGVQVNHGQDGCRDATKHPQGSGAARPRFQDNHVDDQRHEEETEGRTHDTAQEEKGRASSMGVSAKSLPQIPVNARQV